MDLITFGFMSVIYICESYYSFNKKKRISNSKQEKIVMVDDIDPEL